MVSVPQLRADRLLGRGEREGQGEVEDDPTLPKAISNSASATPVSGARGSTASGNGGSSPGRSTPAVIRRKSVVLSKNESLDVLSKGFIATKVSYIHTYMEEMEKLLPHCCLSLSMVALAVARPSWSHSMKPRARWSGVRPRKMLRSRFHCVRRQNFTCIHTY